MQVRLKQSDYLSTYAQSQKSLRICPLDKDSLCKVIPLTHQAHLRSEKYILIFLSSSRHCSSLPDLLQGLIPNIFPTRPHLAHNGHLIKPEQKLTQDHRKTLQS